MKKVFFVARQINSYGHTNGTVLQSSNKVRVFASHQLR